MSCNIVTAKPQPEVRRLQRTRKKNYIMPDNAVYVGRPTKWGNPFRIGKEAEDAKDAVELYKEYLQDNVGIRTRAQVELKGKNLVCWCKPGQPCHADILLKVANAERSTGLTCRAVTF
jgi:hypothetical protein